MRFNKHSELEGRHSFLSPSKYHWLRYSEEKLVLSFQTAMASARGTELHEFASHAIKLGVKLQKLPLTLNQFVNDAIGFGMESEQMLFYSNNSFGTVDAIKYISPTRTRKARLLVFDLKTGVSKASFDQLIVYCALFCLEYGFKPTELDFDLRIYQNNEILVPDESIGIDEVLQAMDRIVTFDRILEELKEELNR